MGECEAAPLPGDQEAPHPPPPLSGGEVNAVVVGCPATGVAATGQPVPAGGPAPPVAQSVAVVQAQPVSASECLDLQSVDIAVGQPVQDQGAPATAVAGAPAVGQVGARQAVRQGGTRHSQSDWQTGWCWTCWCSCCGFCCVPNTNEAAMTGAKVGCGWHSFAIGTILILLAISRLTYEGGFCEHGKTLVHGCIEPSDNSSSHCYLAGEKCCRSEEVNMLHCNRALTPDECAGNGGIGLMSWGSGICMWIEGECVKDCSDFWLPRKYDVRYLMSSFVFACMLAGLGVALLIYSRRLTENLGLRWTECC